MTSLTLAILLQLPLAATPGETYAEAHQKTVETGQPMVVMVGAPWCPACQQMENNVIPVVRKRGLFRRVSFALVHLDREEQLGQSLIGQEPIPQLIVYRKTPAGWRRRRLIGGQSVQTVEQVINEEVAAAEATKKADTAQPKKTEPAKKPAPEDAAGKAPVQAVAKE